MKRQILTQKSKSFFVRSILLVGLLISSMTSVVQAQAFLSPLPDVNIKWAGSFRGKPVFHVEYNNPSKTPIRFVITDEEGTLLYSEKLNESSFSKNFQVNAEDAENFKLILTFSDPKMKSREVYFVHGKIASDPNLVITKL